MAIATNALTPADRPQIPRLFELSSVSGALARAGTLFGLGAALSLVGVLLALRLDRSAPLV